ncbi:ATP-binding protein [Roseateles sp. 22389]|uniref:ATP-binding protein n=1 Tax=Roseateles sp. 22389 TaxID=3453916 RepID=UPI003F865AD3
MSEKNIGAASTADPRALVAQFEAERKQHPTYKAAFDRTLALATRGRTSRVVIVAGPTGVGKSTLGISLLKKATLSASAACAEDPSLVPAVLVRATPPHGRSFNWKDFYVRTLEQLHEPLIDRKVWPSQLPMLEPVLGTKAPGESLTTEALRRQVEHAFVRRQTKLWIVDEAHHILLCHDPRHLAIQFETLKSLADMCNATLVLLGTYKLLEIRDHSAQLIRRSQIVHFPCYRYELADDRAAFKSVFTALAKALPVPLAPELSKDVKYFFEMTAGCVGILRDLLRDGLDEALDVGSDLVTKNLLDRVAQTRRGLKTIMEEAAMGSMLLEDIDLDVIEAMVTKSPREIVAQRLAEQAGSLEFASTEVPGDATSSKAPRRTGPVARRSPARDKVGGAGRVNLV